MAIDHIEIRPPPIANLRPRCSVICGSLLSKFNGARNAEPGSSLFLKFCGAPFFKTTKARRKVHDDGTT